MAANVAVTYNFTAGTPAVADNVDQNFTDLVNWVNTNAVHLDGSKAFTAVPSGPASDPTSANQLTRKAYVDKKLTVCTSGTRPSSPTEGDTIFETDTDRFWYYTGSVWQWYAGKAPRVSVTNASAETMAAGFNTPTFDTENYDTDGMHSGFNNQLTVPAGFGGRWFVSYYISTGAATTSGDVFVQVNGGGKRYMDVNMATGSMIASTEIIANAGDAFYITVYNGTGSASTMVTNSDNYFQASYLGAS